MQTMPFHEELTMALRNVLIADATLLGSVPEKNVWRGNDLDATRWPSIGFRVVNDGPVPMTGTGLWKPTLRLSVHGYSVADAGKMTAAEIAAKVVTLWSIGQMGSVTNTIQTDNFLITQAHLQDSAFLDGALRMEDGGRKVVTYSQLWRVTVKQRTQSNG